ncbi:MAG TPA: RNA polymerase sigma factor [Solirubrobacteraceae bacterium]|nr:RNA polymerase sigma factor [Solirubrobacteraceae bacterium]
MSTALPAAAGSPPAPGRSLRFARLSDELLARYAARGSQRAFGVIYDRYHQPLYRYCRSIVRDEADAQDALQSTFTGALAALQRQARKAPLRPWLYRIAHNESVSVLRRRARDAQHQSVDDATALSASAADEALTRARWQGLLNDLAELPERQRGALLLREMAGLSHEEIAVALGLTLGGAKQAIFEARQGLAEVEEGRAMSCEDVRRRISEGDRRVLRARRLRAHLRHCSACEAFAGAIPARQAELRALAPALPAAAASTILGRVMRAASPHGGSAAGSAATAGAVGKAAGAMVGWKAIAGAALVAGATAGVAGLTHVSHRAQAVNHAVLRGEQRRPARAASVPASHHATIRLGTASAAPQGAAGAFRYTVTHRRHGDFRAFHRGHGFAFVGRRHGAPARGWSATVHHRHSGFARPQRGSRSSSYAQASRYSAHGHSRPSHRAGHPTQHE